MKMTVKKYMAIVGIALAMVACDRGGEHIEFAIDRTKIEVSEVGGTEQVQLSSSDDWIASTDNTWITISPANGRGSTPCKIIIDSALTASPRTGVVRIENTRTWKSQDIVIEQRGYPRGELFAPLGARHAEGTKGLGALCAPLDIQPLK